MAISKSNGLSIGVLLTGGLTADKTEELMLSIIEYLKEVADNTSENNLVRSAFGSVFNFSTSDLEAINNVYS